jgi:hypothetical protein
MACSIVVKRPNTIPPWNGGNATLEPAGLPIT